MKWEIMEVNLLYKPFPHAVIEGVYTEKELKLIWRELDFLTAPNKLENSINLKSSINEITNKPRATNKGLVLDQVFLSQRNISDILRLNRKIFNLDLLETLSSMSPLLGHLRQANIDITKIRYYENNDYYDSHTDLARFTFCTYFYKDRSKLKGGNLYFTDFDYEIETKNNQCVFFVGGIKHSSTPLIRLDEEKPFDGFGKYCMNQFLDCRDIRD